MELTLDTQLKGEAVDQLATIKSLTIVTVDDAQKATDMRAGLKGLEKRIKDFFAPHIERAYEAHKALVATQKENLTPVVEAVGLIDSKVTTWKAEEDRKRAEEQRRLEAEARKRAEDEALAEAEAAEKAGDHETAKQIISSPVAVAPVVAPAAPKLAGASVVKYYGAQVEDMKKLAKAVAEGRAPVEAILPNATFLNAGARTRKQEGAELYPGVRIVAKAGVRG